MSPRKSTSRGRSPKPTPQKAVVSIRVYRRIAATFIVLTVCMFAFIVYLSFSKASIIIETEHEIIKKDFSVNIEHEPSSRDTVQGEVVSIIVQGELEEEATGMVEEKEGIARGVIVLANKTSRDQVLIRTTRLLTTDKKLFRLDEKVTVPANGEVEANIYADELGEEGLIDTTFFTIPGLWEPLQDKIYAWNTEPTAMSIKEMKLVRQEDLDHASEKLQNQLLEEGKKQLNLTILDNWAGKEFAAETIEEEFETEAGESSDVVRVSMELRVIGILYNKEDLQAIAKLKLEESISSDVDLVEINYEDMTVDIARYDLLAENANLEVVVRGDTILKSNSQIFDKNYLVGLDKESAIKYFKNFDSVKSVVIELQPFWLKRIPELRDHIEIKIKR